MWICPKGCHEQDDFTVTRDEFREDTITHTYAGNDEALANELGEPKVYVNDESAIGPTLCGVCEQLVAWESELGKHSYAIVYSHADGVTHRSTPIEVDAQADAIAEYIAVLTKFAEFKSHGVVTKIINIERLS